MRAAGGQCGLLCEGVSQSRRLGTTQLGLKVGDFRVTGEEIDR